LERSLGTKLFVREGKQLKLTTGGVKHAALTNAYFGALRELKEEEGVESKPMMLGAADSIVRWLLLPRFPEVLVASGGSVDVGTFRTSAFIERLESGQLDVGIIRADAASDDLERLPFPTLRFVLMVPRSGRAFGQKRRGYQERAGAPVCDADWGRPVRQERGAGVKS